MSNVTRIDGDRTPGFKLALTIAIGLLLSIPLFSVYLLAYDRQSQMREATQSITAGWGGPQAMAATSCGSSLGSSSADFSTRPSPPGTPACSPARWSSQHPSSIA